jgi:predicted RNA-binding Zn ribbon-like protein
MAAPDFILLGDAVWLDFVNSARGRTLPPPDLLPDPAAFERWKLALRLSEAGAQPPFEAVLRFRQQLTMIAEALSAGRQPPGSAIAAINEILSRSRGCSQLTRVNGEWQLRFAPERAPGALGAIARSAAASLADSGAAVRQCAEESCTLFFIDASPSQTRRWCCPATCGHHARVERRRGAPR